MSSPSTGQPQILVCLKFVPDPGMLQADADGRPDLARAPLRIGTFDENAIEAGLQIAASHGGRVLGLALTALAVPREVILKGLAMGLSAMYLVRDPERLASDPLRVATVLAAAARAVARLEQVPQWDLVICGESSADEFNSQVGPRTAFEMGLPALTYATRLALRGRVLEAVRGLEDRAESVEVDLPALATVGNEINTARMPTVLQIMGAGRKPIVELPLAQLQGLDLPALAARPGATTLDLFSPPSARKRVVIAGEDADAMVAQLLQRLGADGEVAS